ncbi:MAG: class I SAM-dependent methyltransferase [bacterium]
MKKETTSWGGVSDWYDDVVENADSYQQKIILPNLIRIVEPKKYMNILDVGCGTGVFARAFCEKGASIVGIDLGKELIDIAKEKSKDVQYLVASAEDLSLLKNESFDVVTIVLALQNMKFLDKVMGEVSKKMKKGGRLVVVLNHPAFRVPQMSDWYFDERLKIQYRKVAKYMSEIEVPILMNPSNKKSEKTYSFHRPLQVYVKSFAKNNLYITRLEEWVSHKQSQAGPRKNAEDKARKEIPMFMCLECRKVI